MLEIEKKEVTHRIIDEAKLKELEYAELLHKQHEEEQHKAAQRKKSLVTIWLIAVALLLILSIATTSKAGFSPYHLVLFPVIIIGIVKLFKKSN